LLLWSWWRDAEHDEKEVSRVIDVANRHRETIRAIVVGSEVMLRHEPPPARLAALIRRVGEATGLPVTYADVWGSWAKHRVLSEACRSSRCTSSRTGTTTRTRRCSASSRARKC